MYRLFNPISIITNIWKNKQLLKQLIKRDISSRYRGSKLGLFWSFLNPLIMLSIYTFVFSVIFKARWGEGSNSKLEFAFLLFCGIIAFNIFSEVVTQAPRIILNNVNYVKKVVFPIEILPVVLLGSAIVQLIINVIILILGLALMLGVFNWTIIFLPIVLLPIFLLSLGLGWFFASLGVFLRDIAHFIGLAIQALMYLTPIFYPITLIPLSYRKLIYINPISNVVEDMRKIIVWGKLPNWNWLILSTIIGCMVAILGYAWFQKTKGGFSDVL